VWVERTCDKLSSLYGRDIPREEKIRERQEIFRLMKESCWICERSSRQRLTPMSRRWNSTTPSSCSPRYLRRLDGLEGLYEEAGQDLRKVVDILKEAQVSKEKRLALTLSLP